MKTQAINIHNFKAIKNYKGEIGGKHVYLIGGNGTGKTSFIQAVWCGLTGKDFPPEPTHNGTKKGLIEIDLGDFIARTKITKGKPVRFELENKEYTEESDRFIKSPRSYLESKIGIINFDVMDFFKKSDAEQVKYFAKIMEDDFSDIDSEIEELLESRKWDKKKLSELSSQQGYYKEEDAEKEPISVSELSKKIEEESVKGFELNRIKEGIAARAKKVSELEEEIRVLKEEMQKGSEWASQNEPLILSPQEVQELKEKRDKSEEINKTIEEAKRLKNIDEQIEHYTKIVEEATEEIQLKREEKAKRISDKINIEGLTYDVNEERFLYNGLPFDKNQQNTASQLIAGMKIASMGLKELKIAKVDASLIDKVEFEKVMQWAEENEIQLFVELVDREASKLDIIVHEE